MARPEALRKEVKTVPLSRVVMRVVEGRFSVVRQHFECELVREEPIVSNTTRDDASTFMEQAYDDEIAARRESEGW